MGRYDAALNKKSVENMVIKPQEKVLRVQSVPAHTEVRRSSQSLNSQVPITPTSDGKILEGRGPGSGHFVMNGPRGYRVFIPMRNLEADFCEREDGIDFVIRLPRNVAHSLQKDFDQFFNPEKNNGPL